MRIATTEGQRALTMKRLADETHCTTRTLQRYFPSKDALLAEVQRAAIDTLFDSFVHSLSQLDTFLEERGLEARMSALVRVVAAARFWISADETHQQELELSRRLFTDPDVVISTDEASRILPSVFRLLDLGRQRLDDAVSEQALSPGNPTTRAIALIASLTGIAMISKFERWDSATFDGRRMAACHVSDVLLGWGADPDDLRAAVGLLQTFAETVPAPASA